MPEFTLHHGNCLDILKTLPPDSIDSIVTDPPYGLKFMGKRWDYDVPSVEVWVECLRVLKPGGHLLAFAGTRTQHRMAVRIEDAGFEIRDLIMWHYSTGFPKSLNIGCKCSGNNIPYTPEQGASQIPKCDVRSMRFGDVSEAVNNPEKRGQVLLQSVQESGAPEHRAEGADSSTAGGKESVLEGGKLSGAGQGISVGENAGAPEGEAERIRVGAHSGCGEEAWTRPASGGGGSPREQEQIGQSTGESDGVRRPQFALGDEPSTGRYRCEKCQGLKGWNGWGTALKPATEIVTVARKPLIGTVAENVLEHGTGAINVDGCRIVTLTGQRPFGNSAAWEQEKNLCDSCARLAESPARPEIPATVVISAESHAAPTTSGKGESARVDTDKANTGCFAGPCQEVQETGQTADSSLSIGVSGKMLTAQSQKVTKSTTSTATDSTTGLKTCNACGCLITDQSTSGSTQALKNGTLNTPDARGCAALGRWPSNLIHDGSEEVLDAFPQAPGQLAKAAEGGDRRKDQNVYGAMTRGSNGTKPRQDAGSAARFFYCAKASKSDRESGLDSIERVSVYCDAWESADQLATLLVDTAQSVPMVIAVSGAPNNDVHEWSTLLFGSEQTARSLTECRSTIETVTSSTTVSKTLNWLTRSLTSGCTADAKSETANGGSHAESAAIGSPSAIIISDLTVSVRGVERAQSKTRWSIKGNAGSPANHPTVKPTNLMRYLCRLVTPVGGVVLDPFMGSGSTGKAATIEGFRFIGIELDQAFVEIAKTRISFATAETT